MTTPGPESAGHGWKSPRYGDCFGSTPPSALEQALSRWIASRTQDAGWQAVALDGKTFKGSADGLAPGVHLLAAYVPAASAVLAQMRVDAKTNKHKAALVLLGVLPLAGKVVTGDAMFTHKDVAERIRDEGGDYILVAKDNQKELKADIEAAFQDAALSPLRGADAA